MQEFEQSSNEGAKTDDMVNKERKGREGCGYSYICLATIQCTSILNRPWLASGEADLGHILWDWSQLCNYYHDR